MELKKISKIVSTLIFATVLFSSTSQASVTEAPPEVVQASVWGNGVDNNGGCSMYKIGSWRWIRCMAGLYRFVGEFERILPMKMAATDSQASLQMLVNQVEFDEQSSCTKVPVGDQLFVGCTLKGPNGEEAQFEAAYQL